MRSFKGGDFFSGCVLALAVAYLARSRYPIYIQYLSNNLNS